MGGANGRSVAGDRVPVHAVAQEVGRDEAAAKFRWKQVLLIDSPADSDVASLEIRVRHVLEVAKRKRIVQFAVLLKLFHVIGSLKSVHHEVAAVVGAVKQIARFVEVEAPRIAAPFAEEFKLVGHRVVPPHALLEVDAADVGRDIRPLRAVEPAVGSPGERIGKRTGVFHSEAGQQHLGIAVRNIVVIAIGIEEQIGHIQHEHAAVPERHARRQIQSTHKILRLVDAAVAVGVFENRDTVGALRPARRRFGNPVVHGSRIPVDLHAFEAGGIGILQILHDPQPSAIVEFDANRLAHLRLGGHQVDRETVGSGHLGGRNLGRITLRAAGKGAPQRQKRVAAATATHARRSSLKCIRPRFYGKVGRRFSRMKVVNETSQG